MAEKRIHLLHIEDDSVDRMVVERVLKKFPVIATNHHAINGDDALNKLRGTNGESKLSPFPNVILLDINMPKMNGIEFLRELRADPELKKLAAFILSTSGDDADRANAHDCNVAGYIIKPVDITVFESTFRILIDYWMLCDLP